MLQKLTFRPGINRDNTSYTTEGGWYDMDKVRFRLGTPEKIGGWKSMATGTYRGVARALVSWASLTGEVIVGIGTHLRYYINYGDAYSNVTPLRATAALTNPFITTINSRFVRVVHASHGAAADDIVIFSGAVEVGGIPAATINSAEGHQVVTVLDSNTYVINFDDTIATSTVQGGGNVTAQYELSSGMQLFSSGAGWGAGFWNGAVTGTASTTLSGTGRVALNDSDTTINVNSVVGFSNTGTLIIDGELITYTGITGTSFTGCTRAALGSTAAHHHRRQLTVSTWAPVEVKQVIGYAGNTGWGRAVEIAVETPVRLQMRLWSNHNFGQDLIINPRGGGIYYWTKDVASFARAVPLRDAADPVKKFVPHTANFTIVSDVSRFVMALGANPYDPTNSGTAFDPMLVRWSAQNDPTNWVPSATNQAGELRLSSGSYLMCGMNMKQEMLLWTDTSLYSFQYVGPPYVWRSDLNMSNTSLMGPNAVVAVNNNAYWMGMDKFYTYSGRVDTLPCTVQQHVFNDISFTQRFQTFAGTNEGFNEIWWFYVSNTEVVNATQENRDPTVDKYVVFNHAENCWYFGSMSRTAWLDTSLHLGPIACVGDTTEGRLVMHEQGTDDATTDTLAPIHAYIQSSDFDIGDGHQFLFVWRMLPDVSFNGSVVPNPEALITLLPRQNTGAYYGTGASETTQSAQIYSPNVKQYTVQAFTQQLDTRIRGRSLVFRIESSDLGVQWKLGTPRIDARPDGRKS